MDKGWKRENDGRGRGVGLLLVDEGDVGLTARSPLNLKNLGGVVGAAGRRRGKWH